nr:MAG TPA: hypothetical protein [Caudoviricetes sp.]
MFLKSRLSYECAAAFFAPKNLNVQRTPSTSS